MTGIAVMISEGYPHPSLSRSDDMHDVIIVRGRVGSK